MTRILLILITALLCSTLATPLVRRLALHTGVVDLPGKKKIHGAPIPLLGGLAIYGSVIAALLFWGDRAYVREAAAIVLGASLVSAMGLVDDHRGLSAYVRLAGQAVAGVILLLGGTQVRIFNQVWLDVPLTLLWVVGITNAFNLLDNMDGLSSGLATVCAAFLLLFAAMSGQYLVGALAAALMGACIGFLRYNWNPASIFMGDTGSLFIGFLLAATAIKLRFPENVPFVTWMVPVATLAVPIFDTALVTISRLRRGLNPLTNGGKDHLSHRLVALGLSRREAVLSCYLLSGMGGMVATYITQASLLDGYLVGGLLALCGLAGLVWLERACPGGVLRGSEDGRTKGR